MADLNGWIERDVASVWHGFTQMEAYAGNRPVIVERGEGRELIDVEGNRYLDAISSLWVTTLGHAVPELDEAVRQQLGRVAHSTMLGNGNRIVIELAEALAPKVPVDRPRFLFASDGAAAVEQAIKIAFQYWTNQGTTSKTTYLAFGGAYHGDTTGSLAIGDGGFGTDVFDPLRFPVLRTPSLGEPGAVEQAVAVIAAHADELAAVVLEPLVQGAAGMALIPADAVAAVAEAARAHGVLVIHDEVATGFGRTGTLFASEQCGVRPDLMVIGKGITGGYLPLAATVASEQVWAAFLGPDLSEKTFYHGHSYSGNALGCAVALRHLELLDEWDVLANVTARADQLGALLAERIEPLDAVAEVRRCGLMVGVELAPPADGLRWGRRVSAGCVDRGVLIRPLGDVVVLMPPLTTTDDEVVRIIDALEAAIREVAAG
ncbi:MAG TPA: adenosylmethionine--8-amino-7-oxononanoate transaminase [Acidimicrobiales bacterium]|nr:adenosylmethionine--8-amino-7-oxononanoate transaminase [Acidimicrobiales bacterium]